MTQEEKQLLLKDLCARLPYGVKTNIRYCDLQGDGKIKYRDIDITYFNIEQVVNNWLECKPYLRPMSSMTDEEADYLQSIHDIISNENYGDGYSPSAWNSITEWEDYCNARYLDYRWLIKKGLALEAPEDMYKTESL